MFLQEKWTAPALLDDDLVLGDCDSDDEVRVRQARTEISEKWGLVSKGLVQNHSQKVEVDTIIIPRKILHSKSVRLHIFIF